METRLVSVEQGLEKINQRLQHFESSLEITSKAISLNTNRISDLERWLELGEMRQREKNLIIYGLEGAENETPEESRVSMSVIRQMALLPAGCQPWHPNIVAVHGTNFAYAATLAIYIYKLKQEKHFFSLHSIVARHKQSITCLAWHPSLAHVLASGSTDPAILVWDVERQCPLAELDHPPVVPQLLAWHPEGALMFLEARGPFQLWHYDNNNHLATLKEMAQFNCAVTQVAWHPTLPGRLAVGHEDGSLSFFLKAVYASSMYVGHKPQRHQLRCGGEGEGGAICGLAWDPLSPHYLLASCRRRSELFLLDTSKDSPVLVSTYLAPSQAVALACVAWVSQAPGTFISGDADSGVLRIWNVSKSSPLENLRLKQTGFQALAIMPLPQEKPKLTQRLSKFNDNTPESRQASQKALVVCLFLDGGLGIYNLHRRKWDYFRDMVIIKPYAMRLTGWLQGHIETIFDCQFNPWLNGCLCQYAMGLRLLWLQGHIETIFDCQFNPWLNGCLCQYAMGLTGRLQGHIETIFDCQFNPWLNGCLCQYAMGLTRRFQGHIDTIFDCQFNPWLNGCLCQYAMGLTRRFQGHIDTIFDCQFNPWLNGCLCQYAMGLTGRLQGHIETIFDCQFNPWLNGCLCQYAMGLTRRFQGHIDTIFDCQFNPWLNGCLCQYAMGLTRRFQGHIETIFDCQFNPDNSDLLATSSFDGTVKVWNINTMEPEQTSPGNESVIYAISWSPATINCIAGATSKNGVIIWSLEKSAITQRLTSHGKAAVYSVAWNQKDSRKIASAGGDSTCRIHQLDGSLLHTFPHPATVYGCDWHPKNENILATACEDKAIRIFYVGMNNTQMLKMLTGHTAKVFRVRWSPLKDGILCSGSDDLTIRVWDYTTGGTAVHTLEGHTGNVRGLAWSPELPHLLLSGSWDHTIRLWDVSSGTCLDILSDHGADVYGLACHPHRPFLFASSSRDSTVRLWSLQSLVSSLYIKVLTSKSLTSIFSTAGRSCDRANISQAFK
ncbi:WDR17 [Cordylochernes scorpioides]|uniref:WDR17 n=1 Tax=Cordylochernes scorpioides TaxID=51811 RepID=A0ABY6L8I7_9ARAC|nr:WDR17 [Cordylochernes scorpioides]